jgi:hypothetical protein
MSEIVTGSFSGALQEGVDRWASVYTLLPKHYSELFVEKMSDKNFVTTYGTWGFGLASSFGEGETPMYVNAGQSYRMLTSHLDYGLGFVITRNAIDDNLYMELAEKHTKGLFESMLQTKETVLWSLPNNGNTSSYTTPDGQNIYSASHVTGKGLTYSNTLSTAADLSENALEQCVIQIQTYYNDAGLKMNAKAKKLFVPPQLQFEAKRILGSVLRPGTANNDVNALRDMNMFPEGVFMTQYLTGAKAYFIQTDVEDGFQLNTRRPIAIRNDTEFNSMNVRYLIDERYSAQIYEPRATFGVFGP